MFTKKMYDRNTGTFVVTLGTVNQRSNCCFGLIIGESYMNSHFDVQTITIDKLNVDHISHVLSSYIVKSTTVSLKNDIHIYKTKKNVICTVFKF